MALVSAPKAPFTKHQKAYYLDANVANFVRPGVVVRVSGATVAQDGTIRVRYQLTDPAGQSLDQNGVVTPGAVQGSATVAYLPHKQNQYVNYIQNPSTNPQGTTVNNPGDEDLVPGQVAQNSVGDYTFTFAMKAPSMIDRSATHTIGIYVSRDLTSFGLKTYTADDVFSFVPNGSAVTEVHDEIRTQTCNKCHDPLAAHGLRHTMGLCVLCHTQGASDVATGSSADMKVFIHKIHMGSSLPSVQVGTPYRFITKFHGTLDWSAVEFPAQAQNCTFCHEGSMASTPVSGQPGQGGLGAPATATTTQSGANAPEDAGATTGTGTALVNPVGAACGSAGNPGCNPELLPWPPVGANYWLNHPSRAACGACHDDDNFATGENHPGGPQPDDAQCANCHTVQGELPFDASIVGAHTIPQFAPGLPGVVFKLVNVANGLAGKSPTVTFNLHDKSGNPIDPSKMSFLNLVMNGSTGDYGTVVSESAIKGATGSNGTYHYTFQATIPATATGTYTIGIEGFRSITLLPGTTTQQTVRDVGFNDLIDFSVDGSPVTPHPVEATQAQCNTCHFALSLHGTIRQNVQYCLLCHNPTATDSPMRPASQGPAQTIDFPVMVHRIHAGDDATNFFPTGQYNPFIIWGFGKNPNDFSNVLFPGLLNNCNKCHTNGSQELPLPATRMAVTTPRAFINPAPPTTAACTGCHISKSASAHASLNTSAAFGETCDVCHGSFADFSVDKVHAR
jgi:hypothetical protein